MRATPAVDMVAEVEVLDFSITTTQGFILVAEHLVKAVTAQSASSGAQDALSHQPIQETYNERNSN
jgi:hypothetical protein